MSSINDITVLGGGIIGLCTALSLTERGYQVTVIERDDPGQSTSFGNAGVISPWSIVPQAMPGVWRKIPSWLLSPFGPVSVSLDYLPKIMPWGLKFLLQSTKSQALHNSAAMEILNKDCIAQFRSHLAGTGAEHLIVDSYYIHAHRDPNAADLNSLDNCIRRDAGAELERLDAASLHDMEPALSQDFKAAIVIKGQARALSPGKIGGALAQKLKSMGAVIRRETLKSIQPSSKGWTYRTDFGEFEASKLVLSTGVWSKEVLKSLGIHIPLQSERGYHVEFTNPGMIFKHSIMDMDYKFVASSMEGGLRLAGTAEFAGLDSEINNKRLKILVHLAKKISPQLSAEDYTCWSGQRPSFPDSLPAIGEIEGLSNLITAFGHSHYGLMQAPKTGELVADIISGKQLNIDLSVFSPNRF